MRPQPEVQIRSRDYWFKLLENHQTNWALVDKDAPSGRCTAFFFHELSGVFDRLRFADRASADRALLFNGFHRLADEVEDFPRAAPQAPFHEAMHSNGPIYSSGRYWRSPP